MYTVNLMYILRYLRFYVKCFHGISCRDMYTGFIKYHYCSFRTTKPRVQNATKENQYPDKIALKVYMQMVNIHASTQCV